MRDWQAKCHLPLFSGVKGPKFLSRSTGITVILVMSSSMGKRLGFPICFALPCEQQFKKTQLAKLLLNCT